MGVNKFYRVRTVMSAERQAGFMTGGRHRKLIEPTSPKGLLL